MFLSDFSSLLLKGLVKVVSSILSEDPTKRFSSLLKNTCRSEESWFMLQEFIKTLKTGNKRGAFKTTNKKSRSKPSYNFLKMPEDTFITLNYRSLCRTIYWM